MSDGKLTLELHDRKNSRKKKEVKFEWFGASNENIKIGQVYENSRQNLYCRNFFTSKFFAKNSFTFTRKIHQAVTNVCFGQCILPYILLKIQLLNKYENFVQK